jgi:putative chitinase
MIDAKRLQSKLGVPDDGIIGTGTFKALFQKAGASLDRAQEMAICANTHFTDYGVMANGLRLAHFLAQLIHESGSFRYMEELASGNAYEGRKDLGNISHGDGPRFKGRGPLQLTGRANYKAYGRKLGIDLERHPELVAYPSIGLRIACEFWTSKGLNELADKDDVLAITKRINGGVNGLAERKVALVKMKAAIL